MSHAICTHNIIAWKTHPSAVVDNGNTILHLEMRLQQELDKITDEMLYC